MEDFHYYLCRQLKGDGMEIFMKEKKNLCIRLFILVLFGILVVFSPKTQSVKAAPVVKLEKPYLSKIQTSHNSVALKWSSVKNAQGYLIGRKVNSGSWVKIKNTSQLSFVDKDVRVGYTYTYTIKAYKKINGKYIFSPYDKKGQAAKLTTSISVADTHKGSANIFWKQTRGAAGYYIYRATDFSGKYSCIKTITGGNVLKYENNGLKNGQTYFYKVIPYGNVKGKKIKGSTSSAQRVTIKLKGTEKLQLDVFSSSPQINNIGDTYRLNVNNDIKNVDLSQQDILVLSEKKQSNYWIFTALDPGEVILTVTDIYDQTLSVTVTVEQTLQDKKNPVKLISSKFHSGIEKPKINKLHYSSISISLRCATKYAPDGSELFFEGHLSQSLDFNNFKYDTDVDSNINSLYFGSLKSGTTYYLRVRSFTMEGTSKVYGPWSEVQKVETMYNQPNTDNKTEYSYKAYFLDNYGPEVYTRCERPLYIQTDNPNTSSFSVYDSNGRSIFTSYGGTEPIYDDIHYLEQDLEYRESPEKVPGGYIAYLYIEKPGIYNIKIRENSSKGYTVANEFTLTVLDYNTEINKWIDNIISTYTTPNMTPFEKMDAVCRYLKTPGVFRYLTNNGSTILNLAAMPNIPWFKSYRWDSFTSPTMLCKIAERIGGFDDIHNCYYDTEDWKNNHAKVKLTIGNETRIYGVCPPTSTGSVNNINYIDFSNTSRMLLLK